MEYIDKKKLELLDVLSQHYSNVVVIFDPSGNFRPEYYIVVDIRFPSTHNPNIEISGHRNITDIISDTSTYVNVVDSVKAITTRIDSMEPVTKQRLYSNQFRYIKF